MHSDKKGLLKETKFLLKNNFHKYKYSKNIFKNG